MSKVVHCKKESYDVYIGRGRDPRTGVKGIWGNPFVIGEHGDRDDVVAYYEEWVKKQPHLMEKIETLHGKTLGCWCAPEACHGDVLVKLAAEAASPKKKISDLQKEIDRLRAIQLSIDRGKPFQCAGCKEWSDLSDYYCTTHVYYDSLEGEYEHYDNNDELFCPKCETVNCLPTTFTDMFSLERSKFEIFQGSIKLEWRDSRTHMFKRECVCVSDDRFKNKVVKVVKLNDSSWNRT